MTLHVKEKGKMSELTVTKFKTLISQYKGYLEIQKFYFIGMNFRRSSPTAKFLDFAEIYFRGCGNSSNFAGINFRGYGHR